jgi:hypothetical protein
MPPAVAAPNGFTSLYYFFLLFQVCPAKENCGNMRFQKRQYPDVKVL